MGTPREMKGMDEYTNGTGNRSSTYIGASKGEARIAPRRQSIFKIGITSMKPKYNLEPLYMAIFLSS
jgi:hypothetical protein